MTSEDEHSQPVAVLNSAEPQLFVASMEASRAFFVEKLGFVSEFVCDNPPFYCQVRRDNVRINLRLICEPVFVGDVRARQALLSASITVETAAEIKRLFLEFQGRGVRFQQRLRTEPWGARTFVVTDPNGNLLLFAGPGD